MPLAEWPPKGGIYPLSGRSFRVEAAVGHLKPLRGTSVRERATARVQSQRFVPVGAASAASARDAPRDGRPCVPAARPRRGRASGRAPQLRRRVSLPRRPPRASTAETDPAEGAEPASMAGVLAVTSSPCAPCRGWAAADGASNFSAERPPRAASRFGRVCASVPKVPSPVFRVVPGLWRALET